MSWRILTRLTILHLLVWSQFVELGFFGRGLHLTCKATRFLSVIYPYFKDLFSLPLKFFVIFPKAQYFLTILIFLCYSLFLDNQRGCGGIGIRARLRCVWLCLASSSLAIRTFMCLILSIKDASLRPFTIYGSLWVKSYLCTSQLAIESKIFVLW